MLQSKEQYALYWESKHLMRLGKAFEYILDSLVSYAAAEALKYTILAGNDDFDIHRNIVSIIFFLENDYYYSIILVVFDQALILKAPFHFQFNYLLQSNNTDK